MFGGNFAPAGWALCQGQLMPISENDTLFNLIGTTYGGDGQETLGIPDLQGRTPVHQGTGAGQTYVIGEKGGVETVTLTTQQIPIHTHPLLGNNGAATQAGPQGNVMAEQIAVSAYQSANAAAAMAPQSIASTGGSQPHDNMQPYLCINYIISLFGIFPTQN
jgi:microcystin-dependent protein